MGIKNNLPAVVADWLNKQFPVKIMGTQHVLEKVCRPADSHEIERIIDIAHGDQCNKPFEIHTAHPLVTHLSYEESPMFYLIKLGATYKLVFIDQTDDTPQTLRVLNYKKFKGLTNVNG